MRRLTTTRRHVPLDIVDDYLESWASVRRDVEQAGGHAWIFRGAAHEDRFIEFIEWPDSVTAPESLDPATRLDEHAPPAATEEWEEVE